MHLLPLALGRLADHADRTGRVPKYALNTVRLTLNPDNTFEAVATDTVFLARATGPCVAPPGAFPMFPELEAARDGGTTALIPADVWKRVFTWARKLTTRKDVANPACRCVAVRIGEAEVTFGVNDGANPWFEVVAPVSGRFPSPERSVTLTLQKPRVDWFWIDPPRLSYLLTTAAEFCASEDARSVLVETRGPEVPIIVRAGTTGGPEFFGLVMPLTPEAESVLPATDAQRLVELEQENEALRAERDELARQVELLKAALANLK